MLCVLNASVESLRDRFNESRVALDSALDFRCRQRSTSRAEVLAEFLPDGSGGPTSGQAVHEVSLATLRHQQAVSREHTTPPLYQADTMVVQDSALDNCPPYNVQL